MKNGVKDRCCVYNFDQCIYIYIYNSLGSVRFFMFLSQFLLLIKVVSICSKIQKYFFL